MRTLTLALTVVFLAPSAAMATTGGRELVRDSGFGAAGAAIHEGQIAPGLAGSGERGALGGSIILAKGDKSGTGPGHGGHKGQHKGEKKGGQKHDKSEK